MTVRDDVIARIAAELDDWKDAGAPTEPMVRWILALMSEYVRRPFMTERAMRDAWDAYCAYLESAEAHTPESRTLTAPDFLWRHFSGNAHQEIIQ